MVNLNFMQYKSLPCGKQNRIYRALIVGRKTKLCIYYKNLETKSLIKLIIQMKKQKNNRTNIQNQQTKVLLTNLQSPS